MVLISIKKKNIIIIEDNCEALGAKYDKKYLGSFGDFGTFSFFYSHQITSGEGGMIVVLGVKIEDIEKILKENIKNFSAEIANDNSEGQIVLSGKNQDLEKLCFLLKENKIKNIKLPVSAPFHCSLMNKATTIMKDELAKIKFKKGSNVLISNITADEILM